MTLSAQNLRIELRRAGIANAAVDAVWPQWWSSDAESSLSATAELTFTVAKRLGLSPESLLDGEAKFIWRDETKYKRLSAKVSREEAALSSFGCALARAAVKGTGQPEGLALEARTIRDAILGGSSVVDALSVLSFAWGIGIPVLQLRVFPLNQKRMHAMSVGVRGRAVILLAREESYLAPMAFTVAHELGHVMLGHLSSSGAVVDVEAPMDWTDPGDDEEGAADRFALELLTGQVAPEVIASTGVFSATQLSRAVREQGPALGIDPGMLALCAGYTTKQWDKAFGALKTIPPGQQDVAAFVNAIANSQLAWSELSVDAIDYLRAVMGLWEDRV